MEPSRNLKVVTKRIVELGRSKQWVAALDLLHKEGPRANAFLFSAAISVCERNGEWQHALQLLADMPQRSIVADVVCYGAAASACEKGQRWSHALQLLADMKDAELEPNLIVCSSALSACEKCQKWQEALQLFASMEAGMQQDVVSYSASISACEKGQQWTMALLLLSQMVTQKIKPNVITWNSAISSCEKGFQWEFALQLLVNMKPSQLRADSVSFAATLTSCEKCHCWEQALSLLDLMRTDRLKEDLVALNAVISSSCGQWSVAVTIFQEIFKVSLLPDVVSFSALAGALDRCGRRWKEVLELFQLQQQLQVQPNVVFCGHALGAMASSVQWRPSLALLTADLGFEMDVVSYTAVLDACCSSYQLATALQVLEEMQRRELHPNIISYSAVMGACERHLEVSGLLEMLPACSTTSLDLMRLLRRVPTE